MVETFKFCDAMAWKILYANSNQNINAIVPQSTMGRGEGFIIIQIAHYHLLFIARFINM